MKTPACRTSRESIGGEKSPNDFDLDLLTLTYNLWPWPTTFDLDLVTLTSWPWPWPLWPLTLTSFSGRRLKNMIFMFDLDLWPMTLTFNPIQARVKVNLHAKNRGHRSNGLAMRAQTDRRTDRQTHTHTRPIILPLPLTREVKIPCLSICTYMRVPIILHISYKYDYRLLWTLYKTMQSG